MDDFRKPFWAKCSDCSHCWPAAYTPMEVTAFARTVTASRCPMCGSKKTVVAKQDDGA